MAIPDRINIAKDFTDSPGARYKYEGIHSGQEFLEDFLKPAIDNAIKNNGVVEIYLDGVIGYPSSFISGSFGVLSMQYGAQKLLAHIKFISSLPSKIERFVNEIRNPKQRPS